MRLCSIASGSSGNCVYVGTDATHMLLDAGISGKRTEEGLRLLDIKPSELDGILITHEHADHINGLGVLARKYQLPIYATAKTIDAILASSYLGSLDPSLFCPIEADKTFRIKDLDIYPMRISHDAADPVAYRLSYGSRRVGVVTDLGTYNDYTVECMQGLSALLLESNHDVNMLEVGPYPYPLKQRILGKKGHLSNENAGKLLSRLLHDKMQGVLLGHLSHENNLPQLAYETVRLEVTMADNPYRAEDFDIGIAGRNEPSKIITIE